jgi:hypothetical protein
MRSTQSLHLGVEQLDDRLVPSATLLDLTAAGSAATLDNGSIVQQTDAQPTGTGYIHSFVRVQGAASGGGIEQGYNTTARPLQFDENKSPQFTHELTLGQVPLVVVNGHAYREFLLDINQKTSARYLSLDEVRVYLGNVSNLTGYNAADHTLAGLGAIYDLDSAGDVSVKLDYWLNAGSGSGDMKLLIPAELFAGADPGSFVYLYSKMGAQTGMSANSGFEEWAVRNAPSEVPAGTASLAGTVFFDANQDGVFDLDFDHYLAGVTIHLRGVNDLGFTVDLTTTTDAYGNYSFTGLRAGLYSIWETQPAGYTDGIDYVGTAGGETGFNSETGLEDIFANIQLFDGQSGINYIFTEKFEE